jgi:hypothetical protein
VITGRRGKSQASSLAPAIWGGGEIKIEEKKEINQTLIICGKNI